MDERQSTIIHPADFIAKAQARLNQGGLLPFQADLLRQRIQVAQNQPQGSILQTSHTGLSQEMSWIPPIPSSTKPPTS